MSRTGQRGMTFLEMVATATILAILASAIVPVARLTRKRQNEFELQRVLREIRTAIDRFHDAAAQGQISPTDAKPNAGLPGYPADLEVLVKGVTAVGRIDTKLKFMRRIPVDPMTGEAEWGLRCYRDRPDSTSWCGDDVWDVYSKSKAKALDGTLYSTW